MTVSRTKRARALSRFTPTVSLCLFIGASLFPSSGARASWFAEPVISDAPQALQNIGVSDLNLDGHLDVIASPLDFPWLYHVFHGDGTGAMELVQSFPGAAHAGFDAAILRIDGDEYVDFVGVGGWPPLKVWYNDGTGRFTPGETEQRIWEPLVVADVDQDGFDDLAGMAATDAVGVFYGSEAGLDMSSPQGISLWDEDPYILVNRFDFLDLDGDDTLDLVMVGMKSPELASGSWGPALIRWRYGEGVRAFSEPRSFYAGGASSGFTTLAAADLDHDGDQDVVSFSYSTVEDNLFFFDAAAHTFVPGGRPFDGVEQRALFARIDGDDEWDAVTTQSDGGSLVYRGLGNGAFEYVETLPGATSGSFVAMFQEDAVDFLSVRNMDPGGLPIAVWRNLAFDPSDVAEPSPDLEWLVRAQPSVTSDEIRIAWSGPPSEEALVRILDVHGRAVFQSHLRDGHALWDTRPDAKGGVGSGIYWVYVVDEGRRSRPAKVVVVR